MHSPTPAPPPPGPDARELTPFKYTWRCYVGLAYLISCLSLIILGVLLWSHCPAEPYIPRCLAGVASCTFFFGGFEFLRVSLGSLNREEKLFFLAARLFICTVTLGFYLALLTLFLRNVFAAKDAYPYGNKCGEFLLELTGSVLLCLLVLALVLLIRCCCRWRQKQRRNRSEGGRGRPEEGQEGVAAAKRRNKKSAAKYEVKVEKRVPQATPASFAAAKPRPPAKRGDVVYAQQPRVRHQKLPGPQNVFQQSLTSQMRRQPKKQGQSHQQAPQEQQREQPKFPPGLENNPDSLSGSVLVSEFI